MQIRDWIRPLFRHLFSCIRQAMIRLLIHWWINWLFNGNHTLRNTPNIRVIYGHSVTLKWRYNERDGVPKHQRPDCLLNRLFRSRSRKTSKLSVSGLCEGNSPMTGEFPAQRASNGENVSIRWRHHAYNNIIAPLAVDILECKLKVWNLSLTLSISKLL